MAGGHYKNIVNYCTEHNIKMPKKFHATDPSKFVLLEKYKKVIYWDTFDYEKQIRDFFKYGNKSPSKYQVLNFKDNYIYAPNEEGKYIKVVKFINELHT